jgi:YggT family protein
MNVQAAQVIAGVIDIYRLIILVWCILSFFPRVDPRHPIVRALEQLTSPVLTPLRRMLPPVGGMDFSPLLALFLLEVVKGLVVQLLLSI